jgi:hypothetical protein
LASGGGACDVRARLRTCSLLIGSDSPRKLCGNPTRRIGNSP